MLIQCPNCQTTYKVSDEVLKGTTPAFRCSRCKHTFELEANDAPRELPQVTHLSEAAGGEVFRRRGAELAVCAETGAGQHRCRTGHLQRIIETGLG